MIAKSALSNEKPAPFHARFTVQHGTREWAMEGEQTGLRDAFPCPALACAAQKKAYPKPLPIFPLETALRTLLSLRPCLGRLKRRVKSLSAQSGGPQTAEILIF